EDRAVGGGGAADPLEHISTAGVVVRQGIQRGIIRLSVAVKQFLQIPGSRQCVSARVKALFVLEALDPLGFRPFPSRLLLKLHQSDFSGSAARAGMKSALTPHDRLDQRGLYTISPRRSPDRPVLAVLHPPFPPPIYDGATKRQQKQQPKQPAPFHPVLLPNTKLRVERARVLRRGMTLSAKNQYLLHLDSISVN